MLSEPVIVARRHPMAALCHFVGRVLPVCPGPQMRRINTGRVVTGMAYALPRSQKPVMDGKGNPGGARVGRASNPEFSVSIFIAASCKIPAFGIGDLWDALPKTLALTDRQLKFLRRGRISVQFDHFSGTVYGWTQARALTGAPGHSFYGMNSAKASAMLLPLLFWCILILSAIGLFAPAPWPRVSGMASLVLFIIIGLRLFYVALN